jgi:hypothetical protein
LHRPLMTLHRPLMTLLGHEDAPSGVIDPLGASPGNLPGLLVYVTCVLEITPSRGGAGWRTIECAGY